MKEGHKIGQPGPLIKEIKPDEIKAFKEKFAGRSGKSNTPPKSEEPKKNVVVKVGDEAAIKDLEASVTAQGDVVRKLKEAKAEKDAIKVEVDKLLELKKQLAIAQGKDPNESAASGKSKKGKKK